MLYYSYSPVRATIPHEINVLTSSTKQLYFHAAVLMNRKAGRKNLNIVQDWVSSKLAGMVVQIVQRASDALS